MGILYTILTDKDGHYALKLDNEFLYRTDDTINGNKYAYVVDHVKSPKELKTVKDFEAFVAKNTGNKERPDYIEG